MRLFFVLFLSIAGMFFGPVSAEATFPAAKPTVLAPKYCEIYGSVYLERDPRRKANTQYTIFEETEEAFANLVVYKEDNKLFADKPGLWYITTNRDFADFVIFVSPNRNVADFSVNFTTVRSFAGCKE